MGKYTSEIKNLPDTIQELVVFVAKHLKPSTIILFGSRATGENRLNSDFDLCLIGASEDPGDRAYVSIEIDEGTYTLHKVDIVYWENLNENYRNNILKEGIKLYE